jgi:hypothetical protein
MSLLDEVHEVRFMLANEDDAGGDDHHPQHSQRNAQSSDQMMNRRSCQIGATSAVFLA